LQQIRIKENQTVKNLNNKIAAYEKAQKEAQNVQNNLIKRLNANNLRLRSEWQKCEQLPQVATTANPSNGAATNRHNLAAAIIRAGLNADNKLKLCQDTLNEYLTLINGE